MHELLNMVMSAACVTSVLSTNEQNIWYLDSGATSHMTCHAEWLHNFQLGEPMSITLGNNTIIHTTRRGTICGLITTNSQEQQLKLHDVLLIPSLTKNLVSPNHLTEVCFVTIQAQVLHTSRLHGRPAACCHELGWHAAYSPKTSLSSMGAKTAAEHYILSTLPGATPLSSGAHQ
jgi:hypothetical protein